MLTLDNLKGGTQYIAPSGDVLNVSLVDNTLTIRGDTITSQDIDPILALAGAGVNLTIQTTPSAIINWSSVSIDSANAVNILQPTGSVVINRVTGGNVSIGGTLNTNGKVTLISPSGASISGGISGNFSVASASVNETVFVSATAIPVAPPLVVTILPNPATINSSSEIRGSLSTLISNATAFDNRSLLHLSTLDSAASYLLNSSSVTKQLNSTTGFATFSDGSRIDLVGTNLNTKTPVVTQVKLSLADGSRAVLDGKLSIATGSGTLSHMLYDDSSIKIDIKLGLTINSSGVSGTLSHVETLIKSSGVSLVADGNVSYVENASNPAGIFGGSVTSMTVKDAGGNSASATGLALKFDSSGHLTSTSSVAGLLADLAQGNNTYFATSASQVFTEAVNSGTDTVNSNVSYVLGSNFENLTLTDGTSTGGTAALNGTGNGLANKISGNAGANLLSGLDGDDIIFGGAGNDTLNGGNNNDSLNGGTGNDVLTGGAGNDQFVFNTSGKTNWDTVTDFQAGQDKLALSKSFFTKLALGSVNSASFVAGAGAKARDANDFLIYDTQTHVLSYDADGSGAQVMVPVAILGVNIPALTTSDLIVI